jgi:hypothetical protein
LTFLALLRNTEWPEISTVEITRIAAARLATASRTLPRMPARDEKTLAHLRNMDHTSVGLVGPIAMADDGVAEWVS